MAGADDTASVADDGDESAGSAGAPPRVSDGALLAAVENADGPVATTAEVAAAVGMSREGVLHRLHQLADEGAVASKRAGSGIVWWRP